MNNNEPNHNKGKWITNPASTISKEVTLQFSDSDKEKDFSDNESVYITTVDVDAQYVTREANNGTRSLKVTFQEVHNPGVIFSTQDSWNWGKGNSLFFNVTNPSSRIQTIHVRVWDKAANGAKHETIGNTTIPPDSTKTCYMSFSSRVLDSGMRFFPSTEEGLCCGYAWGNNKPDITSIVAFEFWIRDNETVTSLVFDNIKIAPDPTLNPTYLKGIIDQFGQYTGKEWTGKIRSKADLVAQKNSESQALSAGNPALPRTSKYGGWADGPQLHGTGYFRTEKYNGKWSLVDPEGYLFFSTGLDIVRFSDMETWITGRENLFEFIPDRKGSLKEHFRYTKEEGIPPLGLTEGWLFNYYTANLQRKYGKNYIEEWKNISIKRFKNWGFSSIGNWSEPDLFFGKGEQNKIAYVANGLITGEYATIAVHHMHGVPVPDPYDPQFRVCTKNMVAQLIDYGIHNDPWCIGIFVDNELNWGNTFNEKSHYILISSIFTQDSGEKNSYAKRTLISKLKEKYNNNISNLNASWGTLLSSWKTLETPYNFPCDVNTGLKTDLSTMLKMIVSQYYSIVAEELKKGMPNILYLGSRLVDWGVTMEVEEACAKYADVVSYNIYREKFYEYPWINAEQIDMPCIVGEFHFAPGDERMYSKGIVFAEDEQAKGTMYKDFIKGLLENPYFVGAHWFQYVDQPTTGRSWDGENCNVGFVDIADVPYDKLVNAAKEIHSQVFCIRYGTVR